MGGVASISLIHFLVLILSCLFLEYKMPYKYVDNSPQLPVALSKPVVVRHKHVEGMGSPVVGDMCCHPGGTLGSLCTQQ